MNGHKRAPGARPEEADRLRVVERRLHLATWLLFVAIGVSMATLIVILVRLTTS